MVTTYGVISDADRGTSWDTIETFLHYFVDVKNVSAMLLTGEIGKLEQTLKWLEKRSVPTYAIPGSHESVSGWMNTMAKFKKEGVVFDGVEYPRIEQEDHHLVFV